MSALARAESSHYGRLDAAYQRDLDDHDAREAAIEAEWKRLIALPLQRLVVESDEISEAAWNYAAKLVDARDPDDD